ncbi:MAG TPA: hypothetical protein PKO06_05525 [Candidatus Ozemobacteraceae bacterium]|nr:hypothetical protein [Candidatus Ozemobacteraceae bacterium]
MTDFTPVAGLLGGALIGASAALLLLMEGRVAGVSGIFARALGSPLRNLRWRLPFLAGLVLVLCLGGYFSWVAGIIQREMNPKDLAKVSGAYLSDFIVSTLKGYSDNLIKMAPDYAGQAIDTGFLQTQSWLKDVRFLVIGLIDERISMTQSLLMTLLDRSYEEHVRELKPLISNIKTEAGRKAFADYFVTLLETPFAVESVRIDVESLHLTLEALHEKLVKLSKAENLNQSEEAERALLVAAREFWNRYQGAEK